MIRRRTPGKALTLTLNSDIRFYPIAIHGYVPRTLFLHLPTTRRNYLSSELIQHHALTNELRRTIMNHHKRMGLRAGGRVRDRTKRTSARTATPIASSSNPYTPSLRPRPEATTIIGVGGNPMTASAYLPAVAGKLSSRRARGTLWFAAAPVPPPPAPTASSTARLRIRTAKCAPSVAEEDGSRGPPTSVIPAGSGSNGTQRRRMLIANTRERYSTLPSLF